MTDTESRAMGMGRGKVYPAASAGALLNPLRRLVQSPVRTVRSMSLPAGASVLEIGCGPGYFTPSLAAAVTPGPLVALDLQAEMLHWVRRRVDVGLVNADATALPFATDSFDAALIATVLGEVPDPRRCLAEVVRILKPNGVLCVAETRRDSDFTPLSRLVALIEPLGFRLTGRRGPRWQYVARFQLTG